MENLTAIILIFLLFGAAASNKQCLNLKGENETCGYLQICSHSELNRGCRNCTEIYRPWCNEDRHTFRKKYPECEILCERDKREEAEAEVAKLSDENWTLKVIIFIFVGVIAIAAVVIVVFRCRRTANTSSILDGTASPEKKGFMGRVRSCFSTPCERRSVPPQQEDPVQTSRPLVPSAPMPDGATSAV